MLLGSNQPGFNLLVSGSPKLSGGGAEAREWASCHQSPYLCDLPISPAVYKLGMLVVRDYQFLGAAGPFVKTTTPTSVSS